MWLQNASNHHKHIRKSHIESKIKWVKTDLSSASRKASSMLCIYVYITLHINMCMSMYTHCIHIYTYNMYLFWCRNTTLHIVGTVYHSGVWVEFGTGKKTTISHTTCCSCFWNYIDHFCISFNHTLRNSTNTKFTYSKMLLSLQLPRFVSTHQLVTDWGTIANDIFAFNNCSCLSNSLEPLLHIIQSYIERQQQHVNIHKIVSVFTTTSNHFDTSFSLTPRNSKNDNFA